MEHQKQGRKAPTEAIRHFRGKYHFLSNFHTCTIVVPGPHDTDWFYATVEHAFQAAKTTDHDEKEDIRLAETPGAAKVKGRNCTLRADWEKVKLSIMFDLLMIKFQDEKMRQMLLDTGDAELIEGNDWHDYYWGVDDTTWRGKNHLGRLLMAVRSVIRETTPDNHMPEELRDD